MPNNERISSGADGLELWTEIGDATVERGELLVFVLGHFDLVAFAEFHDDIEEVHGIQLKLIAQSHVVFDV